MRFALTLEHRYFFQENQFIAFEDVFTLTQLEQLKAEITKTLSNKLNIPQNQLKRCPSSELFKGGYNLSWDSEIVRRFTHKASLASLIFALLDTPCIRFAFDQYFCGSSSSLPLFEEAFPLERVCCIAPLLGALIIPLVDLCQVPHSLPIPTRRGSCLFVSPTLSLPWKDLFSMNGLELLFIGFAAEKSLFKADTKDLHVGELKKRGYALNDYLKEISHPLLKRRN